MFDLTIKQMLQQYTDHKLSPVDVTQQCLNDISRTNAVSNAFITVCTEQALNQARAAEYRYSLGLQTGLLEGIPVSIKDMIDTAEVITTYGSSIDRNHIPETDAAVVTLLRQQGAVNLGKTNLHEYAFGTTSENSFYGSVTNPWNHEHAAGGSSGGSAAAIAAGIGLSSIGTDTGGSIRIPASACGVVGLKPTFGRVNTAGAFNISWTLDHVGPITRNIEDMASTMEALTGSSFNNYLRGDDLGGIRIGVPTKFINEQLQHDVKAAYEHSLSQLAELGAVLIDVDVDFTRQDIDDVLTIEAAEAGYIHEQRIASSIDEYSADVRKVLRTSHDITALTYIKALDRRRSIKAATIRLFDTVDYIAIPTMPIVAPLVGEHEVKFNNQSENIFNCMIRYTSIFNLSGHPALSIPCGLTTDGLPVGLQIAGRYDSDEWLLRTAYVYEKHYLSELYRTRDRLPQTEAI